MISVTIRPRWYHYLPIVGVWLWRRKVASEYVRAIAVAYIQGEIGAVTAQLTNAKAAAKGKRLPS